MDGGNIPIVPQPGNLIFEPEFSVKPYSLFEYIYQGIEGEEATFIDIKPQGNKIYRLPTRQNLKINATLNRYIGVFPVPNFFVHQVKLIQIYRRLIVVIKKYVDVVLPIYNYGLFLK